MDDNNNKIPIWKKGTEIKYSDRKVIDIQTLVNILRIVYFICVISAILFVAVEYLYTQMQSQVIGERILDAEKIYVYDGDTIIYNNEKIRFYCVDAPEIENTEAGTQGEPYGQEARDMVIEWVENSDEVLAKCIGKDKYGRTLCELWNEGGVNIGLFQVENGLARVFLCPEEKYEEAEEKAQKEGLGIWNITKK